MNFILYFLFIYLFAIHSFITIYFNSQEYIIYISQTVLLCVLLFYKQGKLAFMLFKIQVLNRYVLAVQYFYQWLHYDNHWKTRIF